MVEGLISLPYDRKVSKGHLNNIDFRSQPLYFVDKFPCSKSQSFCLRHVRRTLNCDSRSLSASQCQKQLAVVSRSCLTPILIGQTEEIHSPFALLHLLTNESYGTSKATFGPTSNILSRCSLFISPSLIKFTCEDLLNCSFLLSLIKS